jgi:cyanophycinase-like exopeptidase
MPKMNSSGSGGLVGSTAGASVTTASVAAGTSVGGGAAGASVTSGAVVGASVAGEAQADNTITSAISNATICHNLFLFISLLLLEFHVEIDLQCYRCR